MSSPLSADELPLLLTHQSSDLPPQKQSVEQLDCWSGSFVIPASSSLYSVPLCAHSATSVPADHIQEPCEGLEGLNQQEIKDKEQL